MIPHELIQTADGLRFSDAKATPSQTKAFKAIAVDYLRDVFVAQFESQFPPDTLGAALGLSTRKAAYLISEARTRRPEVKLVIGVLHGMMTEKIAGVFGTRRSAMSRRIFELVYRFDLNDQDMIDRLSYNDKDEWIVDDEYRVNRRALRRAHAAFKLDYLQWRDKK